jgi:hypothetical protein
MTTMAALAAGALGAGLMYMFDPTRGTRRRALARDQLTRARGQIDDAAGTTWRDARNRAQGLWAEMQGWVKAARVDDELLEQRLRSTIGPLLRYPRMVGLSVMDGRVTVTGAVPADEVERLIRHVKRARGVTGVENRVNVYSNPADIPGIQPPIPARPRAPRFELLQRNWSPTARLLTGSTGALLLLDAARRRPPAALALSAAGSLLLLRSLFNRPLTASLSRGRRPGRAAAVLDDRPALGRL